MFKRFTDQTQQVMNLSIREAQKSNHQYIGTEHILLGLLREEKGRGARVLANLGIDASTIRKELKKLILDGTDDINTKKQPKTRRAKNVIKNARKEASTFHHDYVDTEHIVLGLVRESNSVAAKILLNHHVDYSKVRSEIEKLL